MLKRPPCLPTLVALSTLAVCLVGCGGGGGSGTGSGSDARLASLALSVGTLSPALESGTTDYLVWVGGERLR